MRNDGDEDGVVNSAAPAAWMRLARQEIELRLEADAVEEEASLDRELEMMARLRAYYPDVPVELAIEFSRRLQAGSFTWKAWDDAVAWLDSTDW